MIGCVVRAAKWASGAFAAADEAVVASAAMWIAMALVKEVRRDYSRERRRGWSVTGPR